MYRAVAHLAHKNRAQHLLLREVPLPPILSMTVAGNQMMLAMDFVDPAEMAQHGLFVCPFLTCLTRFQHHR